MFQNLIKNVKIARKT